MNWHQSAARVAALCALGAVVVGFGAGLATADPPTPSSPRPAPPAPSLMPVSTPTALPAPVGGLAPSGRDFMPPGHAGPLPQDAVVPVWAPPAPPPPYWAPWVPVVWNTDVNAWGVWWNGSFQKLP